MEYIKVNGNEYPATISGMISDSSWDGRESKTIKFLNNSMSYEMACNIFKEGVKWSIISEWPEQVFDQATQQYQTINRRQEYNNDDFNLAGPITNLRDGQSILVKMGKLTELEQVLSLVYK